MGQVLCSSGRSESIRRLTESLCIDMNHTQTTLGWSPPHNIDQGLRAALPPLAR
jgi:hypothetical protein